jgi:predicted RNA-binding Zn-ribbon protein involved in translation (DUF1610 family)
MMTLSTEHKPTGKTTLYCPECGHKSTINGDWTVRVLVDSTTYECPDCGTTIDSRPTRGSLATGRR